MSAPTLIVGLGGTGSKIVAKVSDMISEKQRRYISTVIFDTDANDIPIIQEKNPEIRVVKTSERMTVGEYLEQDHYARDNWFPVNPPLDRKVLSEGAGQVRSISRLGFESAVRAGGMQPLYDAIQDLFKVDDQKNDQALRVIIVSSLAGGTGSGLIVPVAMYIRRYLEDNFHQNANIIRGFFLLPEVFYKAVPEDQRNNLKSNAYASLRELDAFLMKGNKTLSEEYRDSVKLVLPVPGTPNHEEYDVSPYEFCFLFDAQNSNGEKLNSLEQYMDHAANILYSMSVGPMTKRSNSSEDNVLRKLAREKGRNRYAGAGASRLVYPYDDICRLIGLNWASKSISEQWLEYDRQIEKQQETARKRREEGYFSEDIDTSVEYASKIESDAAANKPFASLIVRTIKQEDLKDASPLHEEYITALDAHIDATVENKLKGPSEKVKELIPGDYLALEDSLPNILTELGEFKDNTLKTVELDARNTAHSVFEGASNEGVGEEKYFLETVLSPGGKTLHPNAVRYLLIKIRGEMDKYYKAAKSAVNNTKDTFDNVTDDEFASFENKTGESTLSNYFKSHKFSKKKKEEACSGACEEIDQRIGQIKDYAKARTKEEVYEKGMAYLDQLIEGYEKFFKAFESQLKKIDGNTEEIYRKYTQAPGMTVRYVAASKECLDKLIERYPYKGSMISLDPALSRKINNQIFAFTKQTKKQNPSRFYSELFDKEILGHYQKMVQDEHAADLDNGILEALKLEADLMLPDDLKDQANEDRYVRNVIAATRNLATPFIEKPRDLDATLIDACAYNDSLVPPKGDESYDAKLFQEELKEKGGSEDPDVDRNEIMFYQSYYGLRANSLSKFSPPVESETYSRSGGEYFMAYSKLIKGIHPNSRKSQEITPHIDRRWHLSTKMPDLDENNQLIEEYGINAAFFWALVLEYFESQKNDRGEDTVGLKRIRLDLEDGTLLANGEKESQRLYEVLDALSLQLAYVDKIREEADKTFEAEVNKGVKVENSDVYEKLENIAVPKGTVFSDEPDQEKALSPLSILALPAVLKLSMPPGKNADKRYLDLLTVSLKESVNYIAGFCSPEELTDKIKEFMTKQLELFNTNLQTLNLNAAGSICADSLDTAANFLDKYHLNQLVKTMQDGADLLKKKS